MAPSPLQQRRTHNTLLFQKLLNLRDGASPFTLVLDTLEQSGALVVAEMARRGKLSKSKIVFVSFTTLQKKVHLEHDIFISAIGKSLSKLRTDIISHYSTPPATSAGIVTKTLLIIDTLNTSSTHPEHLPTFLSNLLISPTISLVATYHTDIPISLPHHPPHNPYAPAPLQTLHYLSTAILSISNFTHAVARKKARDKSLVEPVFGIEERREGVLFGMSGVGKAGMREERSVVVKMELRRKSGRGIVEMFVISPSLSLPFIAASSSTGPLKPSVSSPSSSGVTITLLDEHPLYTTPLPNFASETSGSINPANEQTDEALTTFNLSLTSKQRKDREGVVLPYFDAQKEGGALGAGEGGRILYEMGVEDREDFDDEEDEI